MAIKRSHANVSYGYPNPLANVFPDPIVLNRDPTVYDHGTPGQIFINKSTNKSFICIKTAGGQTTWGTAPSTVTTTLAVSGDATIGGTLGVTGLTTLGSLSAINTVINGTFVALSTVSCATTLSVIGNTSLGADLDVLAAETITLTTDTSTSDSIIIKNTQGTAADAISLEATAGGMAIKSAGAMAQSTTNNDYTLYTGTGDIGIGSDSYAKTIIIGNGTGATSLNLYSGTVGTLIDSTGSVDIDAASFSLVSGTGAINISADAAATSVNIATGAAVKTLVLGSTNGASVSTLACGTGGCNVGTSANAHATTLGSTTASSTLVLQTPSGTAVSAANGLNIGVLVTSGAGAPTASSPIGSLYLRTDPGSATERLYIATDAAGTWTNITCAA